LKQIFSEPRALFYAFAGAMAWTGHFLSVYVVKEFGCIAGVGWIGLAITILTVVFLALCLYALWKSVQYYKLEGRNEARVGGHLALLGIFNNAIFAFIILYQSVPYYYFRECV
jgi:hypothetical protein